MQLNKISNERIEPNRVTNVGSDAAGRPSSASGPPAPASKTELAAAEVVPAVDKAALEDAVKIANDLLATSKRGLEFSIDDGTDVPVISVVDKDTDKLVRQIPSEVILNLIERLDELKGMLFDDEA